MKGKSVIKQLLIALIWGIFLFNPDGRCEAQELQKYLLSLEDDKGEALCSIPVQENSEFAIRFIHSVAKTPVTDHFKIKNGKIYLDKTIYHDFGAGLPHAPENGQKMKAEHGEISITGFDREIPELGLRVGRTAAHTLLLFGPEGEDGRARLKREVPLASLARPGSVIMFIVRPGR